MKDTRGGFSDRGLEKRFGVYGNAKAEQGNAKKRKIIEWATMLAKQDLDRTTAFTFFRLLLYNGGTLDHNNTLTKTNQIPHRASAW